MVIFYDKDTLDIVYTEGEVLLPTLPAGTEEEQRTMLAENNIDFMSLPHELGIELYDFKVVRYADGTLHLLVKEDDGSVEYDRLPQTLPHEPIEQDSMVGLLTNALDRIAELEAKLANAKGGE